MRRRETGGDRGRKTSPHRPELTDVKIGNDRGFRVAGVSSSRPGDSDAPGAGVSKTRPQPPMLLIVPACLDKRSLKILKFRPMGRKGSAPATQATSSNELWE